MDWALVSAVLSLGCILSVFYGVRLVGIALDDGLADLDQTIAAAIRTVLENPLEGFEPPNPIQGAIAQFITTRLAEQPLDIARDPSGKFSP